MNKEEVDQLAARIRAMDREQLKHEVRTRHAATYGDRSAEKMMKSSTLELRVAALAWMSHDGLDPRDAAGRIQINRDVGDAGYDNPYAPGIKPAERRQHPLYVEGDDV